MQTHVGAPMLCAPSNIFAQPDYYFSDCIWPGCCGQIRSSYRRGRAGRKAARDNYKILKRARRRAERRAWQAEEWE